MSYDMVERLELTLLLLAAVVIFTAIAVLALIGEPD
jgi:hypothetical protein